MLKSRSLSESRLWKQTLQPPLNKLSERTNTSSCTTTTSALSASAVSLPSTPCSGWMLGEGGGGGQFTATYQLCVTEPLLWMWPYRRKLRGLHQRAKEPRRTKDKHWSRRCFIWKNNPVWLFAWAAFFCDRKCNSHCYKYVLEAG